LYLSTFIFVQPISSPCSQKWFKSGVHLTRDVQGSESHTKQTTQLPTGPIFTSIFTSWLFTEYLTLLFEFNHTVFK
jgi:hypothetical protein